MGNGCDRMPIRRMAASERQCDSVNSEPFANSGIFRDVKIVVIIDERVEPNRPIKGKTDKCQNYIKQKPQLLAIVNVNVARNHGEFELNSIESNRHSNFQATQNNLCFTRLRLSTSSLLFPSAPLKIHYSQFAESHGVRTNPTCSVFALSGSNLIE